MLCILLYSWNSTLYPRVLLLGIIVTGNILYITDIWSSASHIVVKLCCDLPYAARLFLALVSGQYYIYDCNYTCNCVSGLFSRCTLLKLIDTLISALKIVLCYLLHVYTCCCMLCPDMMVCDSSRWCCTICLLNCPCCNVETSIPVMFWLTSYVSLYVHRCTVWLIWYCYSLHMNFLFLCSRVCLLLHGTTRCAFCSDCRLKNRMICFLWFYVSEIWKLGYAAYILVCCRTYRQCTLHFAFVRFSSLRICFLPLCVLLPISV